MVEDHLDTQQQEVNRLMGRCVLRLQQYERQLKSILAYSDLRGTLQSLEEAGVASSVDTSQQTLGMLVRTFVGSVLVGGEPATPDDDNEDRASDPPSFRMRVRLGVGEEDLTTTEAELRELVQMRNDLIHHFMERHDLWTMEGCRSAQAELASICDRIGEHLVRLCEWAASIENALHQLEKHVRSNTFDDAVVNGINPDGSVFWPGAGIVSALREASKTLAVDGWTKVAAAEQWIANRYPHQTPEKYGCTTLPQVLHESGEFELRRVEKDGRRRRMYCVRDRTT
ncbi:MAG: OST-HTH/LOTUS domain-containing protein [Rhodobacter sp.]|nr:OST-HTH/LOTUS domain-containing protein [Rhodobacter sp.]